MKKPTLLRSLRDLATERASALCSPEKTYFTSLVDVYEEKILDEIIQDILDKENEYKVRPVLKDYCEIDREIPFPFTVKGKTVNLIRRSPEYKCSFEASLDAENWHYLSDNDCVRLFEALDSAGLLSFDE